MNPNPPPTQSKQGHTAWTMDVAPDANGHFTIRPHDGTAHGDMESQPVATVYDADSACLIAAAPYLLAACKDLLAVIDDCKGHGTPIIKDRAECHLAMRQAQSAILRAEQGGGE